MEPILIAFISFFVGGTIAWLIARNKAASSLAVCEANLQTEKGLHQQTRDSLTQTLSEKKISDEAKGEAERKAAISEANLENEKAAFAEYKREKESQVSELTSTISSLSEANSTLMKENEGLKAEQKATFVSIKDQKEFIEKANEKLKDAFGNLSAQALKSNNESFVELAKAKLEEKVTEAKGDLDKKQQAIDLVVKPLAESLSKIDEKINSLETKREGAYSNIATLLDQMKASTLALDKETRSLVSALKTSTSRGRYGEIALRRLVEFAGMLEHCDFVEQVSTETETGKLRPDLIVNLPENRKVVVDSKVPLSAYLEVFETEDTDVQKQCMDRHVMAIKKHLKDLSGKAYWDQFKEAPDFVVLFMQIESSFGAALQVWPGMIEEALNNRIIMATPTTLITMLRSIGYGWNQMKTIENIDEIRDAAVELYERSVTLMEHMSSVGTSLKSTVNHYNKAIGSLEGNFLPQGRRIAHLSKAYTKKALPELSSLEVTTREIVAQAPEQSSPVTILSLETSTDNKEEKETI